MTCFFPIHLLILLILNSYNIHYLNYFYLIINKLYLLSIISILFLIKIFSKLVLDNKSQQRRLFS